MNINIEDLLQRIHDLTRLRLVREPVLHFELPGTETSPHISVDIDYINSLVEMLSRKHLAELTLYDKTSCELLVREESASPFFGRNRDDQIRVGDDEQKIQYELSAPSDLYIIFLLDQLIESGVSRRYLRPGFLPSILRRRIEQGENAFNIFDYLRFAGLRYPTVKLTSTTNRSLADFHVLITSFSFQLSFNLDLAIVPQRSLVEFARGARLSAFRRANPETLDPPRRSYSQDLVYHYQMGLAAESPFVAYLSYYHVAEHFFESVFNDEIVESIRRRLTQPGFSYKRKKDIGVLIQDVKKAFQIRAENVTFNEKEALKITMERFVPIQQLASQLKSFDEALFNYYKSDEVAFSKGCSIPFDDPDPKNIYKALASRIYLTRNSLVHSKDGDKSRYTPFNDDSALSMEIPLLRFIAESIIIENSTINQ